jgi:hypothetical protein
MTELAPARIVSLTQSVKHDSVCFDFHVPTGTVHKQEICGFKHSPTAKRQPLTVNRQTVNPDGRNTV